MKRRMLDLFCGRLGWSKAFLARGWECVGVDLVEPPEIPQGFSFMGSDVSTWVLNDQRNWFRFISAERQAWWTLAVSDFDFICASPPCQQFSKFGMPNFYPDPPYPELGIKLFNHTRALCEASGIPYVIENVHAAQRFVGRSEIHCGPYHLWGTGAPVLVNQGIIKGGRLGTGGWQKTGSKNKQENAAEVATIPPELANCVAEYAERLLEQRASTLDDDCPDCMGTGNFYGNDEDGDFLGCDSCRGTGVRDAGVEVKPTTSK